MEQSSGPSAATPRRGNPVATFLRARWHGEVPLRTALWWDMALVGTVVNLAAMLAALVSFARDMPDVLGTAVYFAPLPYNLLLFVSVWRSAGRAGGPQAQGARALAAAWLVLAIVL